MNTQNRMRILLISAIVISVSVLTYLTLSFITDSANKKTFSEKGLTITLTDDFSCVEDEAFTVCFTNGSYSVMALKEDLELFPEGMSLEAYTGLLLEGEEESIAPYEYKGITCIDHITTFDTGERYGFFIAIFKAEDAFWCISFTAKEADFEEALPLFRQWATSVSFD